MIDSEEAIKRNAEKRAREQEIARQLRDSEETEIIEPLSFSDLCFQLGRQGNRKAFWECPIGAHTR